MIFYFEHYTLPDLSAAWSLLEIDINTGESLNQLSIYSLFGASIHGGFVTSMLDPVIVFAVNTLFEVVGTCDDFELKVKMISLPGR
jgi:acyl-coenzyme A thioesterase PaaI-like protein